MSEKLERLIYIIKKSENLFDRATSDLISDYEVKLEENKKWKDDTQNEIDSMMSEYFQECEFRGEDVYVEPPVTSMDYIQAVSENNGAHFFEKAMNEELLALHEVKLIYSFKQVEISLKQLLLVLDESVDLKTVQRWDSLKKAFNKNGVVIGNLKSYALINSLREVNNALKHSHEITENVKRLNIPQFFGEAYFTSQSLSAFYSEAVDTREIFLNEAARAVGNSLNLPAEHLERFNIEPEKEIDESEVPF